MTSLYDYDVVVNEVFYKCWHILEYIEKHPVMSELDKQAIQATIMDALVTRGKIDPKTQSLDLDNLCIVDNLEHYNYEKHPNICGIPLSIKDKLRKKAVVISGGIPITMFLAKPPSKVSRYCVYDPNTAVSAIFEDATFYNTIYNSPTREGVRLDEVRPFVEVDIDGELYLVDTLTKRILKSSWFKETYDLEIKSQDTVSKMNKEKLEYYKELVRDNKNLSTVLSVMLPLIQTNSSSFAEMKYEIEQSKIYFPDEWREYEILEYEKEQYFNGNFSFNRLKKIFKKQG